MSVYVNSEEKKKPRVLKTVLLVLFFMFVVAVTVCAGMDIYEATYRWDNDVAAYLLNERPMEVSVVDVSREKYSDAVIYHCVTNDENRVDFQVSCRFLSASSRFGFPQRVKVCTDDFADSLKNYVINKYSSYDISDKTEDEVYDYLIAVDGESDKLYEHYGVPTDGSATYIWLTRNGTQQMVGLDREDEALSRTCLQNALAREWAEIKE